MTEKIGIIVDLDAKREGRGLPETPFQRNRRLVPGLDPKLVDQVFDRAQRVGSGRAHQMIEHGPTELIATIREVSERVVNG